MSANNIEKFTPTHCAICETRDFTWADCVHGAYRQALSDAIKEIEAMMSRWAAEAEQAQARGIQVVADGKASRALAAKEIITRLRSLSPSGLEEPK